MAGESLIVPKGKLWIVTFGPNAKIDGQFLGAGVRQIKVSGGSAITSINSNPLYISGLEFDYESNPIKIQKSKVVNVFLKQGEFFKIKKPQLFKGYVLARDEQGKDVASNGYNAFVTNANMTKAYSTDGVISGVMFEIY